MFAYIADRIESLAIDSSPNPNLSPNLNPSSDPKFSPKHFTQGLASRHGVSQTCVFGNHRVMVCGYPGDVSKIRLPPRDRSLGPIAAKEVAALVSRTFAGCPYLVFNLSNEEYDYAAFEDQVVAYALHKYPSPPFDLLCEIVDAVKGWLDGDASNVCVIHDISGRRSMVVLACLDITESMENDIQSTKRRAAARSASELVGDALVRLRSVANARAPIDGLVPSQRRYMKYYATYMEATLLGRRSAAFHTSKRLVLQRVIVNGVPDFVNESMPSETSGRAKVKCVPFIKIYAGGELIGGTCPDATVTTQDGCFRLEPVSPYPKPTGGRSEASKPCVLSGDVLLKVFHWAEDTKRAVPMFSVMFHTGFVADNVLHLDAEEVDGAKHNARFPPDFFVDCFFAEKAHAFVEEKGEIGGASGLANVDPDPEPPQEGKSVERRVSDEEAKTSIELAQTINEIEEILKDAGEVEEEDVDFEALAESLDLADKDELDVDEVGLSVEDELDLDEFVSTFDSS